MIQARRDHQYAAANGALQLIGKAAGLFNERPQIPVQIKKVTVVLNHETPKDSEANDTSVLEAPSYRVLPDAYETG